MSEKEEMVVPRSWNYVHRTTDPFLYHSNDGKTTKKFYTQILKNQIYAKKVCYLVHNQKVIERCEYRVNAALCYSAKSDIKIRALKVDFTINEALYARLEDDKQMADYLVLVGDDQIMFFHIAKNFHTVISVPFRIYKVYASEFGLLIERSRFIGEEKSGEPECHIFSLTHPFSEILPVLYKSFYEESSSYAFSKHRICLIPPNGEKSENFFLAFDIELQKHMLFVMRKITATEREEALNNLDYFISAVNSPANSSFASSVRTVNFRQRKDLENTSFNSRATNTTPLLRRSIRNKGKQASKDQTLPLDEGPSFNSSCFSYYASSDRRSVRNTFRVFNIDGKEIDELEVDFILVCVWMENLELGRGLTPQTFGTSANTTPKSILSRKLDAATPSSVKDTTPNRSVKFVQKENIDEGSVQQQLPHKRAVYQTPVKPVSFKDVYGSGKTLSRTSEIDLNECVNYPNARLLVVIDELIARHREKLLGNLMPKQEKKARKKKPISRHDYIQARMKIMRFYSRMMLKKHEQGDNSAKAYMALLLYRRELYQIVKNEARSKAENYKHIRVATRFFISTDMKGQKYVCFLIQQDEILKLLKWESEKGMCVGVPFTIEATDAVNVLGSNMIAVMRSEKSTVTLYTGNNEIGNMLMKPYRQSIHQLLQFCNGYEKTVVVKIQHNKRLLVQNIMFDLDFVSSDNIQKLFEAVFANLPMVKAVQFYSKWCASNHLNMIESEMACVKKLLIEIPLIIEHFFVSMGLDVQNLMCAEILQNLRKLDPFSVKKRDKISRQSSDDFDYSDDEQQEPMEIPEDEVLVVFDTTEYLNSQAILMKRKITIKKADGKEDFIGKHAHALFHIYHLLLESFNIFLTSAKYKPLLLEPLYIFAKITHLDQYAHHYLSCFPQLSSIEINVVENIELPSVNDALAFDKNNMITFNEFLSKLKLRNVVPEIPEAPHWPLHALFAAVVAEGKISKQEHITKCLGAQWSKRLRLTPEAEKALISVVTSTKSDNSTKCSRCVKLFCLSTGDIYILQPILSRILTPALNDLTKKMEKEVSRRLLRVFPSDDEQSKWLRLRWSTDIRVTNVYQMLDSRRQILIPVRRSGFPDDETANREQYNIFLINAYGKQVSKSFGYAAIGFRTTRASKVSSCHIPKIELSGRVPPNHVFHEFPNGEITKSMNDWSDFMAGTGHTLTLTDYDEEQISFGWLRQWQATHRSPAVAAGSLFAYGLAGHFKNVNVHEVHKMIVKSKKAYEIVAILLGAAITHRGTSHLTFYRAISTHIPSFIEPTLVELKFDAIVQTASILGIGFLFQGTVNTSISNKIINEMAKETFFEGENEVNRYSYVLTCGIAVGLINLAQGINIRNSEVPAADSNFELEDRLITLLEGGKRAMCTDFGRRNEKLCRIQRIGAAALGSVALPPSANACTTVDFAALHGIGVNPEPNGMATTHNEVNRHTANSHIGVLTKESSTTRELSTVNIHLTPPGACIALALMYLKTGDKYIIEKLRVPGELPDLESIRPDVLMLRSLCALMVDYENVLPSENYVLDQIPPNINDYVQDINTTNQSDRWWTHSIDMTTIAEAYYYIKCGICLAIGIRYASTFNVEAYNTIQNFFLEVKPGNRELSTSKVRHYVKAGILNRCAALTVYALSLVMAGSGDLSTLRMIRRVRNYLPEEIAIEGDPETFSIQTLCNLALGHLFLGNARYGFSHSNEAVAMLLIASYPILPHSICDQKHYFQPMRFFWSIATEFRHLAPIDDDNHQPVRMKAQIKIKGSNSMALELPSVLPPLEMIEYITLESRDYKKVEIDMTDKEDRDKLFKVLKEFYGRLPVKKIIKKYAKIFESLPVFQISDADDCSPNTVTNMLVIQPLNTQDVDQLNNGKILKKGIPLMDYPTVS